MTEVNGPNAAGADSTTVGGRDGSAQELASTARTASNTDGGAPHLAANAAMILGATSAGAGLIHVAMVPPHAALSLIDGLGFAVAGGIQLWVAGMIATGQHRKGTLQVAVWSNLAILSLWAISRTAGLPWGSHKGVIEPVAAIDLVASGLAGVAVLAAAVLLLRPTTSRSPEADGATALASTANLHTSNAGLFSKGQRWPIFASAAVLALASSVLLSPTAAQHAHTAVDGDPGTATLAGGHSHGGTLSSADHANLMETLDDTRCDTEFNHPSYWNEAATLGVDTYQGGAMDVASDQSTAPKDPNNGRGSQELDALISATGAAAGGEVAAARLVALLGKSSAETHQAWQAWMRSQNAGGGAHAHSGSAAPDDNAGHGGHVGANAWTAMTDPKQCAELKAELKLAKDTAAKYPTVADAEAAGWEMVTPYVDGIAAHYMKFSIVDSTFQIDEPEMLLYDGTRQESRIVGLSYYLLHEGDAEPSQGFTGPNDHFHRHVGLCTKDGVVVGDSTTTEEDCTARGGKKAKGDKGWMAHAWVVPGCESPWGVFSGASPVLERSLAAASGTNEGGCSASSVRDRYQLDSPA